MIPNTRRPGPAPGPGPWSRRAVLAGGAIILAALLWPVPVLEVQVEGGNRWWLPLIGAAPLFLTYEHSVERQEVVEVLAVTLSGLVVTGTYFSSGGAGLPSSAPGLRLLGNTFYVEMERFVGRILVGCEPYTRHRLEYNGAEIALSRPDGSARAEVSVRAIPRLFTVIQKRGIRHDR